MKCNFYARQKGETMSRDEVRRMIDEVDDNKDGRLDYREVRAISFLKEVIRRFATDMTPRANSATKDQLLLKHMVGFFIV